MALGEKALHASDERPSGDPPDFAVAMAFTYDYAEMAAGLLARVRQYHPLADLFLFTDEESYSAAKTLANAFSATDLRLASIRDYPCGDWNSIVTAKFDIFGLSYADPILFLDTDQILYRELTNFIEKFANSGAALAGSADDESFADQFKPGAALDGIAADAPCINTGAFMIRADASLYRRVVKSLDYFAGRGRLPTQSVINGLAQIDRLPILLFGEDFMAGPFSAPVLHFPRTSALLHFWTPRPPFMKPNPIRQGEISYEVLKRKFSDTFGEEYPEEQLRLEYVEQLQSARQTWKCGS